MEGLKPYEIFVPKNARIPNEPVRTIMPQKTFYTAGYGCVISDVTTEAPMGPEMTYHILGDDLGLQGHILVRTKNLHARFPGAVNTITHMIEYTDGYVYRLGILPIPDQRKVINVMGIEGRL